MVSRNRQVAETNIAVVVPAQGEARIGQHVARAHARTGRVDVDEAGLPVGGRDQGPRDRHQRFPRNGHLLRLGSNSFGELLTGGGLGGFVCHDLPAAN